MNRIERELVRGDTSSLARSIVLVPTSRRWVIDITEDGTRRRCLPEASWRAIADELGISTPTNARQIYCRTLKKLPDRLRRWIDEPERFV